MLLARYIDCEELTSDNSVELRPGIFGFQDAGLHWHVLARCGEPNSKRVPEKGNVTLAAAPVAGSWQAISQGLKGSSFVSRVDKLMKRRTYGRSR